MQAVTHRSTTKQIQKGRRFKSQKAWTEHRGLACWLGSRSQGTCIRLDWVCSLVRVLLPVLWKEFMDQHFTSSWVYLARTVINFWLKALRIHSARAKKKAWTDIEYSFYTNTVTRINLKHNHRERNAPAQ